MRVLFLGKKDDAHCRRALDFTEANFRTTFYLGDWKSVAPWNEGTLPDFDLIVSYLSRWVVPAWVLERAPGINFHPASPDYPGIGCTNFALYDEAAEYGATCHFMAPRVDTGAIVATRRFPVLPSDDVASLLARTYDYQLALFFDIMGRVLAGEPLEPSGETWTRKAYTRAEFNELGRIRMEMSDEEIARRVRATSFGQWQPTIQRGRYTFKLEPAAPVEAPARIAA